MPKQSKPFGTWSSPLSAKALAGGLRLSDVQWDTTSDTLVWLEGRGAQGVLVAQNGTDAPRDLTSDLSVRAMVGYGGGDFTVAAGHVYFAGPGGRLYRQALAGGTARPITPAFGSAAAPRVSPDGKWLAYVHTYEHNDGIALVDVNGEMWPAKLAYGTDFVMQPAWHPQGKYLAYIAWNHPQMPWDGTELRLITFDDDPSGVPGIANTETIVGDTDTSIFQPEFSPDGRYLAYANDATGWWQLYLYDLTTKKHEQITTVEAEHAIPAWVQGMRTHGWSHDSQSLYFLRSEQGFISLGCYSLGSEKAQQVKAFASYSSLSQLATSTYSSAIAVIASSASTPARVISYVPENLAADSPGTAVSVDEPVIGPRIHKRSGTENLRPEQQASVEAITWTGHDDEIVHGLYYAPTNEQVESSGKPPLMVMVHGGPTGQSVAGYDGRAQFFASRGFAVLDVNYRGSAGYGVAYRNKLRKCWGVYDVEDCASGAKHLADQGKADASKLVIMGGSAGGFTVYQSLIDKPGFYKAGICLFGVADQFGLAMETHKFEERYLDTMLGPLPEAAATYRLRSPIFHADKLKDPIAIYQGEIDQVVPQNQSDRIAASLKARGIPHEYTVYAGEGHGWRKPETIEAFYDSVLAFLQKHVLFA